MNAARLSKLILMLSSNHEGEVVAAANLIGTTLRKSGMDWHDLVRVLTTTQPETQVDGEHVEWHHKLYFCLERKTDLREREQNFLESLKRWRGQPTEKQTAWLTDIFERLSHVDCK